VVGGLFEKEIQKSVALINVVKVVECWSSSGGHCSCDMATFASLVSKKTEPSLVTADKNKR